MGACCGSQPAQNVNSQSETTKGTSSNEAGSHMNTHPPPTATVVSNHSSESAAAAVEPVEDNQTIEELVRSLDERIRATDDTREGLELMFEKWMVIQLSRKEIRPQLPTLIDAKQLPFSKRLPQIIAELTEAAQKGRYEPVLYLRRNNYEYEYDGEVSNLHSKIVEFAWRVYGRCDCRTCQAKGDHKKWENNYESRMGDKKPDINTRVAPLPVQTTIGIQKLYRELERDCAEVWR